MRPSNTGNGSSGSPAPGPQNAPPGKGGGAFRVWRAFWNSLAGIQEGFRSEAAIRQEIILTLIALPVSLFVARDLWTWVALIGSLLLVLTAEFLNSAIEKLCDHIHPHHHEAIGFTKDFGSAGVFFTMCIAGIVWLAALWMRFS